MKKVINYLGLRKVAINLQLDKLPADADQYVAEVGAELEEELRQIDQALMVLSNAAGQIEHFCECDGVQDLIAGTGECRKCGGQCTY